MVHQNAIQYGQKYHYPDIKEFAEDDTLPRIKVERGSVKVVRGFLKL